VQLKVVKEEKKTEFADGDTGKSEPIFKVV
jgi:hypothetical protein